MKTSMTTNIFVYVGSLMLVGVMWYKLGVEEGERKEKALCAEEHHRRFNIGYKYGYWDGRRYGVKEGYSKAVKYFAG